MAHHVVVRLWNKVKKNYLSYTLSFFSGRKGRRLRDAKTMKNHKELIKPRHTSSALAVCTLYLFDIFFRHRSSLVHALPPTSFARIWRSGERKSMFCQQRWDGSGRQKLSCEDWSSANGEKTTTTLSSWGQRHYRTANSQYDSCEVDAIKWQTVIQRMCMYTSVHFPDKVVSHWISFILHLCSEMNLKKK